MHRYLSGSLGIREVMYHEYLFYDLILMVQGSLEDQLWFWGFAEHKSLRPNGSG